MKISLNRNSIKSFFFYTLIIIFSGCNKEETVIPEEVEKEEIYFTLNTNDFEGLESEDWIIIHNSEGVILDYKVFEKGEILEFKEYSNLLTDKITITHFSYATRGNSYFHEIKTFTEINKGSIWHLFPDEESEIPIGKFNLSVNHPTSVAQIMCSSSSSSSIGDHTYYNNGRLKTDFININLSKNNNCFTSIFDYNDGWKYKILENVQDGDDISLDYSEFQNFDRFLNINLPQNVNGHIYYLTRAIEDPLNIENYSLINASSSNTNYYPETLKLSYLNMFDKYKTYISFYTNEYFYTYRKDGGIPNEIVIPEKPSIIIEDESIFNFKLITNVDYNYRHSIRSVSSGTGNPSYNLTRWNIFSPKNGSSIISNIPIEITQKYSNLDIQNLNSPYTTLTLTDRYYDFIDREFITGKNNLNDLIIETIGIE